MMIEEMGIVERVEDGYIWVNPVSSGSACGHCKSSGNCSTSLLTTLFKGKARHAIRIHNTVNAKLNDTVVLGIHSQGLLSGAVLIYLLPIMSLFLFSVIGSQLVGEVQSIIIGLAGLIFGLWVSKKIANSFLMKSQLEVVGLRVQLIDTQQSIL